VELEVAADQLADPQAGLLRRAPPRARGLLPHPLSRRARGPVPDDRGVPAPWILLRGGRVLGELVGENASAGRDGSVWGVVVLEQYE